MLTNSSRTDLTGVGGRRAGRFGDHPQASFTFSFYSSDEWQRNLADNRTIKQWYDTADGLDEKAFDNYDIALIDCPPN